jgi:hypothetical protein
VTRMSDEVSGCVIFVSGTATTITWLLNSCILL